MKRINFIASLIKSSDTIVDIGCDHCHLAIYLLKNKIANKVINIDINSLPLQQGIINLKKKNLLEKTENIVNDGLKNLHFKDLINYIVISGLGAYTIINILKNNKLKVNNFILQSNNKHDILRKFLIKHFYKIIREYYVRDNKVIYAIFLIKKTLNTNYYSKESIYFGHLKHIDFSLDYYHFLNNRLQFLNKKIKITNISKDLMKEHKLLVKRIKHYECKGNL